MLIEKNLNQKIWILVGTRPEVIKQASVYQACVNRFGKDQVALIGTGQHSDLLTQALQPFGLKLDTNLTVMIPGQSLNALSSRILSQIDELMQKSKPDWIIVQGDTTSAAMAAWAAFQHKIKIAHNEAGLRSQDLFNPYPEEANRKLISVVADLHFAPTQGAKEALIKENISKEKIVVTGNPGIDSLYFGLKQSRPFEIQTLLHSIKAKGLLPVLLTAHRRENHGAHIQEWFETLRHFLQQHSNIALIYPMHPNNIGKSAAENYLKPLSNVYLQDPLDYIATCHLLSECLFLITDSGGLQEEAGTLSCPTVVCRETTERVESIDAGLAKLVGTKTTDILAGMHWAYKTGIQMTTRPRTLLYGDGNSGEHIAALLHHHSIGT